MFQFNDDVTNKLNLYVNKQDQQQDRSNNLTTKTFYRSHSTLLNTNILNKVYPIHRPVQTSVETPLTNWYKY